jgi:hypothetical protein
MVVPLSEARVSTEAPRRTVNEHIARSQATAPSELARGGRLPARLRHRRILPVPPVPPVPSHAGPAVHGAP